MEAIILAGGLGTRLRSVLSDIPKSLAPIQGKAFLCHLLDHLKNQGITRVGLATGFKHESIQNLIGFQYNSITVDYSPEKTPLGTGGAIKKALAKTQDDLVVILNGDTFFKIDLKSLWDFTLHHACDVALALKQLDNTSRYGTVQLEGNHVTGFKEKNVLGKSGLINGGVYVVKRDLFTKIQMPKAFSFENDFLVKRVTELNIKGLTFTDYFIDIGVPEDYERCKGGFQTHPYESK
jgi:D-glycero-alpha-D-manno-heptose 1-phosphate guanylyltransferase